MHLCSYGQRTHVRNDETILAVAVFKPRSTVLITEMYICVYTYTSTILFQSMNCRASNAPNFSEEPSSEAH